MSFDRSFKNLSVFGMAWSRLSIMIGQLSILFLLLSFLWGASSGTHVSLILSLVLRENGVPGFKGMLGFSMPLLGIKFSVNPTYHVIVEEI